MWPWHWNLIYLKFKVDAAIFVHDFGIVRGQDLNDRFSWEVIVDQL